jgi:hypothetical protein
MPSLIYNLSEWIVGQPDVLQKVKEILILSWISKDGKSIKQVLEYSWSLEVKKKVLILMSFRQVIDSNSEWF